ncbi:EF-hand domain-containing protein [Luteimonas sp. RD2P54]|uniref:EF-hand domain-containing protein n=1 Tax=Luteimonas endophytica TaxID=3042023 RepID=A0ABT6JBA5_9GAMM|nr:EF-hand domain-containing protein [Luteimonas endophytica]MDH5824109.1 EF-hand domain-containing protein [Luteimonas endophytica]
MKSTILFTATLLALTAFGAAAAAHAATDAPGQARMKPDANGDGAIDRTEAAAHPRLAARFDQLDRNGDGRLDAGERPAHRGNGKRGERGHPGRMGGMGRGGIARLDTDGDGRIGRAEIETAPAAAGADGSRGHGGHGGRQHLLQNFAAIDADNDGHIVRSELRAWHRAQRPQRHAAMANRFDERFKAADLNGDGKLSRVEVEEKMPRMAAGYAWMDEDRDGFLSRAELEPQPMR